MLIDVPCARILTILIHTNYNQLYFKMSSHLIFWYFFLFLFSVVGQFLNYLVVFICYFLCLANNPFCVFFQMLLLFYYFVMLIYQLIAFTNASLKINLFFVFHCCQVKLIHRFKITFFIILNVQSMNMLLQSLAFTHNALTRLNLY